MKEKRMFWGKIRKGQAEIVNMVLFLLIAILLLFSVFIWGSSVVGGNSEEAKLFSSEQFMRNLDAKIQNVAKNGGVETLKISQSTNIRIVQGNIIEYAFQGSANVPADWIYISGDNSSEVDITEQPSVIREEKYSDGIRMQLYYRNRTGTEKFLIYPFIYYEGLGRNIIRIENNGSATMGNLVLTRVKLSV